jgi:hypothetical protein
MEDRSKSRAVIVLLAFLLIASSCFGAMGDIRYSQIGASNTVVGGVWNGTGYLYINSAGATSIVSTSVLTNAGSFDTNGAAAAVSNAVNASLTNASNSFTLQIGTNATAITTVSNALTTASNSLAAQIGSNTASITASSNLFSLQIGTNTTKIASNTATLTNHTAQIGSNTASIAAINTNLSNYTPTAGINTNALNTGVTLLTNGGTAVFSSLQVSGNGTNYGTLYVGSQADTWGLLTAHSGFNAIGSVTATNATNASTSSIANVGTLDSRYIQQTNLFIETPSNSTDFTVLPGGVVPVGNQVYFADKDINSIWTISKSDSSWKIIQKTSP